MTWRPGTETEHPSGRKRDAFEVVCDAPGCHRFEFVGRHGGDAEKIQKLLLRRGWGFTAVTGGAKDLCPIHAEAAVVA